jgi:hypothetical protein
MAMASTQWLKGACVGTLAFGAALLLLPAGARAGFSLLLFGDAAAIAGWPEPARGYVTLLHGVLGAVMVGWALALLLVLRGGVSARQVVAASVAAWFVPDTLFSALVGAWPNVALNTVFALLFAAGFLPLSAGVRSGSRS